MEVRRPRIDYTQSEAKVASPALSCILHNRGRHWSWWNDFYFPLTPNLQGQLRSYCTDCFKIYWLIKKIHCTASLKHIGTRKGLLVNWNIKLSVVDLLHCPLRLGVRGEIIIGSMTNSHLCSKTIWKICKPPLRQERNSCCGSNC